MSYLPIGATPSAEAIAAAAAKGLEWYEPGGGKAGYWRRKTSTSATRTAEVTVTPANPERAKCMRLTSSQRSECLQILQAGGTYADFQAILGCKQHGYTAPDQIAICAAARQDGRSWDEVDEGIAALLEQAPAAQQSGKKFPLWLLAAGGGAAILAVVLLKRKKKGKRK